MGLLDELGGGALGGLGDGTRQGGAAGGLGGMLGGALGGGGGMQGMLLQALLGMLAGGGLQRLIGSFQQRGHGDAVRSWVGTGENQPISPEDLQQAMPDELGRLSQQTGVEPGALAGHLSGILPQLVDRLTPNGQLPAEGASHEELGGMLKGL